MHQRPEGIKCLRAAIAVSCELGGYGAGNQAWPIYKNSKQCEQLSLLSNTLYTVSHTR